MSTDDQPTDTQPTDTQPAPGQPTSGQRELINVPVKRYDVTLSMEDLLTPLQATADNLTRAGLVGEPDSEVAQHLKTFTDLVNQLTDVTRRINELDANLLVSKPGPPPTIS